MRKLKNRIIFTTSQGGFQCKKQKIYSSCMKQISQHKEKKHEPSARDILMLLHVAQEHSFQVLRSHHCWIAVYFNGTKTVPCLNDFLAYFM